MSKKIALLTFMSVVFSSYYITNPSNSTVWNSGDSVKIEWKVSGEPSFDPISVNLVGGTPQKLVGQICTNLSSTSTSCNWNPVPNYIQTIKEGYSIRIDYTDSNHKPLYDYSSSFQINGTSLGNSTSFTTQPAPKAW